MSGVRAIWQYWDSDEVPGYVTELAGSFRRHNPDFRHRIFSERDTERFIEQHFGPRELAAFRTCAVPAMQADYFRYCVVLALGGIYADVDYRCIRSLGPLVNGPHAGEIFLSPTPRQLNGREATRVWNGFFAFARPGHPFLRLTLELATANIEARIAERVWPHGDDVRMAIGLTVGPGIPTLMRFMREWGSFDAFLDGIAGSPAEPFGELYCEVIGSYERIAAAFEGVRVSPHSTMTRWVRDPDFRLPYKSTDAHWHNVTTPIFR